MKSGAQPVQGTTRKNPVALKLGFSDEQYGYSIELGLPAPAYVADAFPGSRLSTPSNNGYYELEVHQHGLLRPLKSAELSDGTLRYLLLVAALLSPRPPPLMVLNEPETSLHADLLPALARLIAKAAENCQVVVVTHAAPLVSALCEQPNATRISLEKTLGETSAPDHDPPAWSWPAR
jgi:predicted ATPase